MKEKGGGRNGYRVKQTEERRRKQTHKGRKEGKKGNGERKEQGRKRARREEKI